MTERVRHLWWRAGFGAPLSEDRFRSEKELLDFLLKDAASSIPLPAVSEIEPLRDLLKMTPEEKALAFKNKATEIRQLNFDWMMRLSENKGVLREKMTLFWTNHFSCRSGSPKFTRELNQVIRENALGKFGDLLLAVSKSPAMLQFLNNQQNRKAHPNENFAREVMELFTLGRGNYTEADIREAARAFTGWSFDKDGGFEFRARVHDEGEKTILGETGRFKGEDVLRILLGKKQTSQYVVRKFWHSFVSDVPDQEKIDRLADEFYQSDYDILQLIKRVFSAEWFYKEEYRGGLIKSPVELMVPLIRDFNVKFANINVLLGFQKILGQVLFNPPNVAGWPGGKNWIDSSSLAVRMRTALLLIRDQVADFEAKDDADANNPFKDGAGRDAGRVVADWTNCYQHFGKQDNSKHFQEIANWLMAVPLSAPVIEMSSKYVVKTNERSGIQSIVTFLTGLPEYQLC